VFVASFRVTRQYHKW